MPPELDPALPGAGEPNVAASGGATAAADSPHGHDGFDAVSPAPSSEPIPKRVSSTPEIPPTGVSSTDADGSSSKRSPKRDHDELPVVVASPSAVVGGTDGTGTVGKAGSVAAGSGSVGKAGSVAAGAAGTGSAGTAGSGAPGSAAADSAAAGAGSTGPGTIGPGACGASEPPVGGSDAVDPTTAGLGAVVSRDGSRGADPGGACSGDPGTTGPGTADPGASDPGTFWAPAATTSPSAGASDRARADADRDRLSHGRVTVPGADGGSDTSGVGSGPADGGTGPADGDASPSRDHVGTAMVGVSAGSACSVDSACRPADRPNSVSASDDVPCVSLAGGTSSGRSAGGGIGGIIGSEAGRACPGESPTEGSSCCPPCGSGGCSYSGGTYGASGTVGGTRPR